MRRAASFLIPFTLYYALCVGVMWFLLIKVPAIRDFFPIGGLGELAGRVDSFETVYSSMEQIVYAPNSPLRLAFASLGAAALIIPVSWIYFITSRTKEVSQSIIRAGDHRHADRRHRHLDDRNEQPPPGFQPGRDRRSRALSFYARSTLARNVHFCSNQYWPGSRHRGTGCCRGNFRGICILNINDLAARIRKVQVRRFSGDVDATRSNRGRLLAGRRKSIRRHDTASVFVSCY